MQAEPRPQELSAHSETDEGLVAKLRHHDEGALRLLHVRYAALVFTVAARIVDASAAEEIVQDVFLTIWRKADTFDPERGAFKSWILQIARRRALNELRRRRVRGRESDDALSEVADESATADEAQWASHRRAVLRKAIDALPAPQKQALSLAYFEDLTHEQVASVLQMPLGTAKTRIRLAMRRLTPLVAALLVALAIVLGWSRERGEQALERRALRLVTASDVVPIHLEPVAGTPPDAHGTYRAKAGADVAVLTASNLPPPASGERYEAWVRHGEHWSSLGFIEADASGRSVVVGESPALASPADEVRVTRESRTASTPQGPAVLAWRSLNSPLH
jgi:RNA polymerase sigma-70 factor (ECF subfamily)